MGNRRPVGPTPARHDPVESIHLNEPTTNHKEKEFSFMSGNQKIFVDEGERMPRRTELQLLTDVQMNFEGVSVLTERGRRAERRNRHRDRLLHVFKVRDDTSPGVIRKILKNWSCSRVNY